MHFFWPQKSRWTLAVTTYLFWFVSPVLFVKGTWDIKIHLFADKTNHQRSTNIDIVIFFKGPHIIVYLM